MISLKQVLTDIARAIVQFPDEVTVVETADGDDISLILSVSPSDMGKVIGKHGKIAKSIRSVVKAAANSANKRVNVEIR